MENEHASYPFKSRSDGNRPAPSGAPVLRNYYALRSAVSAAWVVLAVTVARQSPPVAASMLVAYPAWDAIANYADARRSGGIGRNRSQALNVLVSAVAAIAVVFALEHSLNAVLAVYAVWAALAGLLQLVTGARRWKQHGAQWVMILSGAQSVLAAGFMAGRARSPLPQGIADIAPYAGFGSFYFLLSALWLTAGRRRGGATRVPV